MRRRKGGESGESKERRAIASGRERDGEDSMKNKGSFKPRFSVPDFVSQLHKIWNGKCGFNHVYTCHFIHY